VFDEGAVVDIPLGGIGSSGKLVKLDHNLVAGIQIEAHQLAVIQFSGASFLCSDGV